MTAKKKAHTLPMETPKQTLTEKKIQFIKDRIDKDKTTLKAEWCKEFYGDRGDGIPEQKFGYMYGSLKRAAS